MQQVLRGKETASITHASLGPMTVQSWHSWECSVAEGGWDTLLKLPRIALSAVGCQALP